MSTILKILNTTTLNGNGDQVDAYELAQRLHDGQTRWYTDEPYFQHVQRVADSVMRSPEYRAASQETKRVMICSALLHDAVEDTDLTPKHVLRDFGPEVAEVVGLLTHDENTPYHAYMLDLMEHPIARVIKRADTCDNLATLPVDDEHSARLWSKYLRNIQLFQALT